MADPLDGLGALVAQRRGELGLSLREAALASGIPAATLSRIEQGRMPDLGTFRRLVEWLGLPADYFFGEGPQRVENTPAAIAVHLRADPALTPDAAERIAGIVRDLYENLAAADRRLAIHLRAAKTFSPPALRLLTEVLDEIQAALDARTTS